MGKSKEVEWEINEIGCHLVTSHKKEKFGHIRVKRNGKLHYLHRLVYEQHFGEIPDGLVIRHTCDNPSCINIEHLKIGTVADNNNDKVERGRSRYGNHKGVKNANHVLSEEIVMKIRSDKKSSNVALADNYSVTHQLISKIRKGHIWKHLL